MRRVSRALVSGRCRGQKARTADDDPSSNRGQRRLFARSEWPTRRSTRRIDGRSRIATVRTAT